MSQLAIEAVKRGTEVYIRTVEHPAARELEAEGIRFNAFDSIYESAGTFEEVYAGIADMLIAKAQEGTDLVYAVPGHPLVGERSVELVVRKAASLGVKVKIEGSMSFIESCLEALAVSVGRGLKVLDALEMDSLEPDTTVPNLIYQVYSREIASEVKLRLMESYPDEFEVSVITGGPEGSTVDKLPLYMLDRREFDHLASVFVPVKVEEH